MLSECRLLPDTSPGSWRSPCPTSPSNSAKERQDDSSTLVSVKREMSFFLVFLRFYRGNTVSWHLCRSRSRTQILSLGPSFLFPFPFPSRSPASYPISSLSRSFSVSSSPGCIVDSRKIMWKWPGLTHSISLCLFLSLSLVPSLHLFLSVTLSFLCWSGEGGSCQLLLISNHYNTSSLLSSERKYTHL